MTIVTKAQTATQSSTQVSQRLAVGVMTFFIGAFLVYGIGLAQNDQMHNAAHDTRHSIGFPCH